MTRFLETWIHIFYGALVLAILGGLAYAVNDYVTLYAHRAEYEHNHDELIKLRLAQEKRHPLTHLGPVVVRFCSDSHYGLYSEFEFPNGERLTTSVSVGNKLESFFRQEKALKHHDKSSAD